MIVKPNKTIQCVKCKKKINLFADSNIKSIICPTCNACLDGKTHQFVRQLKSTNSPNLPLKNGMKGMIEGVEFIVVGVIRYIEDGEKYCEYQLYSSSKGYALLERDDFHYIFSYEKQDEINVFKTMNLKIGEKFIVDDINYSVIEKGIEKVNYVSGEINWKGNIGKKSNYITGGKPPYLYTVTKEEDGEIYFSFGEKLNLDEIDRAFNIQKKLKLRLNKQQLNLRDKQCYSTPTTNKPTTYNFNDTFLNGCLVLFISFIICLFLTLYSLVAGKGTAIYDDVINCQTIKNGEISEVFEITKPGELLLLKINGESFNNAWGSFNIGIRKDNVEYLNLNQSISYYSGRDAWGESWSEGVKEVKTYLRLPEAGFYSLAIIGDGGFGESGKGFQEQYITVSLFENIILTRYFLTLTILFGFATLVGFCRWSNR